MGLGQLLSFVVLLFAQSGPAVAAARTKVQAVAQLVARGAEADEEKNLAHIDQTGSESPPKDCATMTGVKKMICEANKREDKNQADKENNYKKPKKTLTELAAEGAGNRRIRQATRKCEKVFDKPCWNAGLKTGYCMTWCLASEYNANAENCAEKCPEICRVSKTNVWRNHGKDAPLIAAMHAEDEKNRTLAEAALKQANTQIHFLPIEAMLREHLLKCICVHRNLPGEDQSGCHDGSQGLAPKQKWCEWGLEQEQDRIFPPWRKVVDDYKSKVGVETWPGLDPALCIAIEADM